MRIALVHSFYNSANPSGENAMVLEQARALSEAGHVVTIVARHTDDESKRLLYPLASALRVATGIGGDPSRELAEFEPDVVHVHNLFPNFGTRWLDAWPGPLVATVHNYRYACANAVLLRDGDWCTDCPDGRPSSAVRHGCYRGSPIASVPLAIANRKGVEANPVVRRADRLVVLSPVAAELFTRFAAPVERMRLVPNFTADLHHGSTPTPAAERFLAVGRLSAEKGFARLIAEWPAGRPLDIVGSASADAAVSLPDHPDVRMLGAIENAAWRGTLERYTAMVVPSYGPEGAVPLVAIEAWEGSVPVVTRHASGLGRYVDQTGAGAQYDSAASLSAALDAVTGAGQALRDHVRGVYEATFTEPAWQAAITGVYSEAIASR
jgi:glycosyltransferase involved in cell wall biosynthesis